MPSLAGHQGHQSEKWSDKKKMGRENYKECNKANKGQLKTI